MSDETSVGLQVDQVLLSPKKTAEVFIWLLSSVERINLS